MNHTPRIEAEPLARLDLTKHQPRPEDFVCEYCGEELSMGSVTYSPTDKGLHFACPRCRFKLPTLDWFHAQDKDGETHAVLVTMLWVAAQGYDGWKFRAIICDRYDSCVVAWDREQRLWRIV